MWTKENESERTDFTFEDDRTHVSTSHSYDSSRSQSGVDVARAERDFVELNKELSNVSQQTRRLSTQESRQSRKTPAHDIEKIGSIDGSTDTPWDLESSLHGSKDAETEAGIKPKHIGVVWDGLTVRGFGGVKTFVQTFPDAVIDFFNVYSTLKSLLGLQKKGPEVDILHNFRGVLKPGEMVLVLGRPGSGCTTFLKVIADQRDGYTSIDGEVMYGPFDSLIFAKRFRGEAVYNQEDDVHHPTLTVGQTLSFALDTKTPGKRPPGVSKEDFKTRTIRLLLKMFNIEHTFNTVVGNAFIRGVSGGERKRVSIAEMMATSATVLAWDNTTRGLDASTALDFAKSLRIMTNIYKTTTFVSLYQASENIYNQFDKVLLIDEGRQVFFGPISEARAYFENLGFMPKPRQTTPDYLTGCTDAFEREYQDGIKVDNVPSTPEALVKAFDESKYRKLLDEEMTAYRAQVQEEKRAFAEFELAHKESKRKYTSNSSVYSIPFITQVWVLMQRQFLVKWQDKFSLTVSWVTSIGMAVVLGTVWYQVPDNSSGAFTRGGLLFMSLLLNAFGAFAELGSTMLGRPIVNKHRAFTFHRPSALWVAQILIDTAFISVQICVFSIIVYFMCGLVLDAGAFFTFVLIIISGYLAMTLVFRTIGCLCPDFDYASKFAAIVFTLYTLTAGYVIQYQSEQVWLRWIFYINATGLGLAALMMNEFKRLTMTCEPSSLVPSGPDYGDIAHQTCTLQGSSPGSALISGTSYLRAAFTYEVSDLWRNFGILVGLIATFLIANAWLGETISWGVGGRTITFYQKEDGERTKLNEALMARKQKRQYKEVDESSSDLIITSKAVLTWEDLNYDVPTPSGTRRLLNSVYGYVQPGKLTALMGASGAGKTTLLDVLAARKNIGVISGDVLVDGKKPGPSFQRGTSYAEQLDVHEHTQTVREVFRFSAELRQPFHIPLAEKHAYVEEIITLLELELLADAIIGSPEIGLSVEERKRVTIGVELAAKPELLLFLDEPTSGLDSQSAFNIVRFLRKLAAAGQAILCTIHQPNSALFQNFDRLLLLQKGGNCVYFGDIGKDSQILLDYFERNGAHCPPNANPAEWMLDAIGAGQTPRIGDRDWSDVWRNSPEFSHVQEDIRSIKSERVALNDGDEDYVESEAEYATPTWHQIKTVVRRTNIAFWRSPNYGFTRLFTHAAIALLAGLMFLQLDNSRSSLQYRIFVLFQFTVIPAIIIQQVEPKYELGRLISYRESASKTYKPIAFAISMVIAEMPYSLLCTVVFYLPIYFIPGFQSAPDRAGYQFLMVFITEIFAVTLGQMIAAITPSMYIASQLNPPLIIVFALFSGVAVPKPQIPRFWRSWLYQLNPFTRLIGGMLVTELHDREVVCKESELNSFTAPAGQTCGEYMSAYFEAGGLGYITDNATSNCEYCAYKVGDQYFAGLGLSYDNRWRDLGIFAAFIVSNLVILFIGARYLKFNKR